MITDEKIQSSNTERDQEILKKILDYKEKYSPEELKSILSLMENTISKIIITKIFNLK